MRDLERSTDAEVSAHLGGVPPHILLELVLFAASVVVVRPQAMKRSSVNEKWNVFLPVADRVPTILLASLIKGS